MPGPTIIPLTVACLLSAASHQNIHPAILWGLWGTERGWVGASVLNTNGSHDLGPLQINDDTWLPTIARLQFNGDQKAAREKIQYDGCYNAQVAAWIFAQELHKAKGDVRIAIGHYHSPKAALAEPYTQQFMILLTRIYHTSPKQKNNTKKYEINTSFNMPRKQEVKTTINLPASKHS